MRERGKNQWELRVGAGRDEATGKYRVVTRTVRGTKTDAQVRLAELITEVHGPERRPPPTKGTVAHLLASWLANVELSPTTRHEYERLIDRRITPTLGDTPLAKLTAFELDAFYRAAETEGLSSSSVRQMHAILRKALGQAVKWQWLPRNPASDATPPRLRSRELAPPDPVDVRHLIRTVEQDDPEFACLLLVAATTGARRGELCGLRWADIDLEHRVVRIHRSVVQIGDKVAEKDTKTHQERRLTLGELTAATLVAHRGRMETRARLAGERLEPDGFVWSEHPASVTPFPPHRLTSAFRAACKAAGVSCRLHDLRHYAATQMLTRGTDVRTAAGRLGHANAATTLKVYAHFMPSADERAAAQLDALVSGDP